MKRIFAIGMLAWASQSAWGCDFIGVLDGLALAKARVDKVELTLAWVERRNDKKVVTNGMLLCRADRLITVGNVHANLLLGSAGSGQQKITVEPRSIVHIHDERKVQILGGRLFANVKDLFDVLANLGVIAAAGTQFTVEVTTTDAQVVQIEGDTKFTRAGTSQGSELNVPPLSEVRLVPDASQKAPESISKERCKAVLNPNSEIVSATRAKVPSLPVSRNFNPETVGGVFAVARAGMLCERNENETGVDRERVGLIYADWADPAVALQLLEASPAGTTPDEQARHFTAVGNALRLEGEPDMALGKFRSVLSIRPGYAPAENGMGDALRDKGLNAFGITVSAKNRAAGLFELARQSYEAAAKHGGGTPEYELALVNTGNLLLLWSGLLPANGDELVDRAQGLFEQAIARSNGRSLQARLGLARVEFKRAQLIPQKQVDTTGLKFAQALLINEDYRRQADQERRPYWEKAEVLLRALTNDEPEFAPGWQTLGEIYLASSKTSQAKEVLFRAMSADPRHKITYFYLGRAAGEAYADAYKAVEFPAMQPIAQKRDRLARAQPDAVTVASNLLIPAVSTVRFDAAQQAATGHGRAIDFKNVGEAPVTPTSVTISGADAGSFSLQKDDCSNQPVAPQATCRIIVAYQPLQPGNHKARLEVSSGGSFPVWVELRGRRVAVSDSDQPT